MLCALAAGSLALPLAAAPAGAAIGGSLGVQGAAPERPLPPAIGIAVASHSLRKVLRKGLVVSYSVREPVAGRFEVLLERSIARRLGLHRPPATGLAAGTPPQVVIGKALLITDAGGRSRVTIRFGRTAAKRLRRLHGVSLMLRVVVRNASRGTATVLTSVKLAR
jgi:hypothetical protein